MRRLNKLLELGVIFVVLFSSYQISRADCTGCCSWHEGVVCQNGVTMCGDGTPLSDTCVNKGCNICPDPPSCDASHLDLCYTQNSCDSAGGYWCDNLCQSDPCPLICDSVHLDLCFTQESCQNAGGNWCNETCQSELCPSCDPSNLSFCSSEISCLDAGGRWCYDSCSEDITREYSTAFPSQAINKINIASFNIQIFGTTKASKPDVMQKLAEIISEFDIVAIQEIRDLTGTAIEDLEMAVDRLGTDYDHIIGPRVGRTSSQEQYAYMYRKNTISIVDSYTYDDTVNDLFEREPFIARFQAKTGNLVFVLITIHTKPDVATNEISYLDFVVADAEAHYPAETDFMILGDFNSDCSYFDENTLNQYFPEQYYSTITGNDFDTNLSCSECTYDRIIVSSDMLKKHSGSKGVFEFDRYYDLLNDQANDISDHYPVWAGFNNSEGIKSFPWFMLLLD